MKPSTLTKVLTTCVEHNEPVLLKGPPGCGKTSICEQVAKITKRDFITVIPAISDPTDGKGVPGKNGDGKWEWHLIGDARRIIEAKKPTLVLIDDLGQAAAMVQAAYMQWILLRRIGEHPIPDCVTILAATNRKEDRAGVTGILEPVKSRFITILELTPDETDWVQWAMDNDMPPEIIGFAHFRWSIIHQYKAAVDIVNGPCPRTLANVGRLIKMGLDDGETLMGAVGEGCAVELLGFLKYYKQLPNLSAILVNPDDAEVPDEPAALYAVVSGLVEKVAPKNFERILKYGNRLPADFSILLVRDCIRKEPNIQHTKAFINWMVHHKNVLVA
jgi:hypothetical protein